MEFTSEQKEIYKTLTPENKKAFREAVAAGDLSTVARLSAGDLLPDEKRKQGRPARGMYDADIKKRSEYKKQFSAIVQPTNFNTEIVPEAGAADLDQIKNFADLYQLTIDTVCARFFADNPQLIKKHPSIWYNKLLMDIKKDLPKLDYINVDRVAVAWEAFKILMYNIGLFPTMEAFHNLTGLYLDRFLRALNPAAVDFYKNMRADCKAAMTDQVNINPVTQVNKLFILKSVYGFSEAGPVSSGDDIGRAVRNIDDIPLFEIDDKNKNN